MSTLQKVISYISGREVLTKLLKNLQWLILDRFIRYTIGMVISILIARYLGPEEYGILNYGMAFSLMFSPIALLSSDNLVVRNLSWFPNKSDEILGTFFFARLYSSILCLVASAPIAFFIVGEREETFVIILIFTSTYIFQASYVVDLYYQAELKNKNSVIIQNIGFLLSSAFKVYLLITKASIIAFAIASAIEFIISGMLFYISYRIISKGQFKFSYEIFRNSLKDISILVLMSISIAIQARFDQILIKKLLSAEELGLYSVALKIVELIVIIPTLIFQVSLPAVSSAKIQDEKYYVKRLEQIYRFMFFFSSISTIALIIFSDEIIILLYGIEYEKSAHILPFLTSRIIIASFGLVRTIYITNENLFSFSLFTYLTGATLNIVLNYILIPKFGVYGAIISANIGFIFTIFLLDPINRNMRKNTKIMIKSIFTFYKIR
ncbi:MAG: flippase [Candidatus Calescibacterium sp.]|nr:flippase [Candidatus Calescibacterium sp.]MDW8087249.1 flippase [Candidatus Calescibacterium sp.]